VRRTARTNKGVAENQKSESFGGYTGYRRDFLWTRSVSLLGGKRT
jgi:hypothetical protein